MNENTNLDFVVTDLSFMLHRPPRPEWRLENSVNDNYILALALGGRAKYIIQDQSHEIKKADMLFFPPGLKHSAFSDPDDPWSYYSIAFNLVFFDESSKEVFDKINNVSHVSNIAQYIDLFNRLNWSWTRKKTGYLVNCRGLLMELIYHFIRENLFLDKNIPHINTIERIINMISDNYSQSYTVDELAKMANISASHFRLLFKRVAGVSAIQYQNKIKISKAQDLIVSGECNVTEAAMHVGYHDVYYFSRLFKKTTGVNPSVYARR